MAPLDQIANNAGDGHAAMSGSQNLYADYMKSVPSLAKKIESGSPGSDDVKNTVALTFEDIYKSAGGGAAGTKAEDAFQNALNDQLKADGSTLHIDTVHSTMLLRLKQNAYAIEDSSGRLNGSGIIAPERVGMQTTPESTPVNDQNSGTNRTSDSGARTNDGTNTRGDSAQTGDGGPQFPDKRTEQLYNRTAEDAALAVMSKSMTDDQKAQAVLDAMNKAGVHNGVDLDNFDNILTQKLGKNAHVEGVRTQALFASQFRGVVKIDTGRGDALDVPFNTNIKGDLVSPTKH
jgi:hypothetical protein